MKLRLFLLCLLTAVSLGCTPSASSGGFDSDNPASRLYAIRRAGEAREVGAIPHLVTALDSDDPAVRMMAINALERITGTRLGYNPYAAAAQRRPAVEAWARAVTDNRFATAAPAPQTRPASDAKETSS